VLAIEAASTSFAGFAGLILGEAGWNHDGGFSLGYSVDVSTQLGSSGVMRTYDSQGRLGIR
jgi:hypothetical protein